MKLKPLLSLAAIGAALLIGVYVILGGSGNMLGSFGGQANASACDMAVEHSHTLADVATGEVAAFRPLDAPLDLSEIAFKDRNGNPAKLGDWKGKTVLFNLWATWCPPCREEMPYFETLQSDLGGDTFDVVPVSIDTNGTEGPLEFYEETGLEVLPYFQDETMEAFQGLRRQAVALGMPTTLLMDTNGCGLGVLNGAAHWASDDAVRLIKAAIELGG